MGRRNLELSPQPRYRRTREPEARWVYERAHAMWEKRGWLGNDPTDTPYSKATFKRGLQIFSYIKAGSRIEFAFQLESGRFTVCKNGADYFWGTTFGLPKIPDDAEIVEIKLAL